MAKGKQQRGNNGKAVAARPAVAKGSSSSRQSGGLSARFAVIQGGKKKPQQKQQQGGPQQQRKKGDNKGSNAASVKGGKPQLVAKNKKAPKQTATKAGKQSSDAFKAAANPSDLDMEMDQYWFKAGKGPDPNKASLDREMDEYFKQHKADASNTEPAQHA